MENTPKILFLCTGNSCRSQMAEGWARKLKSDAFEAYSAGIETHGMNPRAVRVMAEAGVDISDQSSTTTADLPVREFDYVITVCWFPAKTRIVHHGFDDPPRLTKDLEDEEKILAVYRRVRDEVRAYVETLPESLLD
jgi:arsenate reductase